MSRKGMMGWGVARHSVVPHDGALSQLVGGRFFKTRTAAEAYIKTLPDRGRVSLSGEAFPVEIDILVHLPEVAE